MGDKGDKVNTPFSINADGTNLTAHKQFVGGHPEWDRGNVVIGREGDKQTRYDTEIKKIVEQLRAGHLNGQQGAEAIVRAVVKRRGAALNPELRQQLETCLTQMLAADPQLAARVRELGGATSGDD